MKLLFLFGILFSQFAFTQVAGLKTVIKKEADLFLYSEYYNYDKEPEQIHNENMNMIKGFIDEVMDVTPRNYRDARNISADAVYDTLD